MDIAEYFYYNIVYGCIPDDVTEENIEKTNKTVQYLLDAGMNDSMVIDMLTSMPRLKEIDHNDIPKSIWDIKENNLLKKDTFYYHNILHIIPPAPRLNVKSGEVKETKFFIEMIIFFTLDDLYRYYMARFGQLIKDKTKTIGGLKYLLNRYKNLVDRVESIDIVLNLIDTAYDNIKNKQIKNPLDLQEYENEIAESFIVRKDAADLFKTNVIVWR